MSNIEADNHTCKMGTLHFSDFKQEIERLDLKNPKIIFDTHSVKIIALPNFTDLIDLLMLLFFFFIFINSLLLLSLICFIVFWHRLYLNFKGCGIIKIDFVEKTITTKNRFFLINIARKVFGLRQVNRFSSIKEISYTESRIIDKLGYISLQKRYFLFFETYRDAPIAISQFEVEETAKEMTAILKKFLLNHEEIIA